MSGMYTMLPLTQVLREGERRETGERKGRRETGTVQFISHKTGVGDIGDEMHEKVYCSNLN